LEAENLSNENTDPTNSSLRSYSPHNTTQEKNSLSLPSSSLYKYSRPREKERKKPTKNNPSRDPERKRSCGDERASE
jgi:hypothetical protein